MFVQSFLKTWTALPNEQMVRLPRRVVGCFIALHLKSKTISTGHLWSYLLKKRAVLVLDHVSCLDESGKQIDQRLPVCHRKFKMLVNLYQVTRCWSKFHCCSVKKTLSTHFSSGQGWYNGIFLINMFHISFFFTFNGTYSFCSWKTMFLTIFLVLQKRTRKILIKDF